MKTSLLLILTALLVASTPLCAAERVALVIGNASYEVGRLANPVNDATDVAASLRAIGFEVVLGTDVNREDMLRKLGEFRTKVQPGGLAVVYYSGHGIEVDGQNWLLPVRNGNIRTQADVPIYSVSAQDVLRKVEEAGARLNFFVLDACRDNPLPAGAKSASRGLGRIETGTSTLVAYATSPGKTAADGTGRNSPYTKVLKEALKTPGLSVTDLVNQVGAQVQSSTGGSQVPWNSGTPIWPPISLASSGTVSRPDTGVASTEGELRIEVVPATAQIRMDGDLLGSGSRSVRLAAGKRIVLRAEAEGYEAMEERVLVQGGQVADVVLRLRAKGGAVAQPTATAPPQPSASGAIEPSMVVIPAGTFEMGSPSYEEGRDDDEGPTQAVEVRSFKLGKFEVTVGEFRRFVEASGYQTDAERNVDVPDQLAEVYKGPNPGCYGQPRGASAYSWAATLDWRDPGFDQEDDYPVVCVSWTDAQAYIKWLNGETGKRYRLPSEAEQEYANRAGGRTAYAWGTDANQACRYANVKDATPFANGGKWTDGVSCSDGANYATQVGRYQANGFGLYDTIGNALEWSADCYAAYAGGARDSRAVDATNCDLRVLRGAGWSNPSRLVARCLSPLGRARGP